MNYLHPRYWPLWTGLGILRMIVLLPWSMQMSIGKWIGVLLFHLLKSRRRICCINLELAFPELSEQERKTLNKKHFISLAQGIVEAGFSWWGNNKKLQALIRFEGLDYFYDTFKKNKRLLILSGHFTSLEIGGRLMALAHPEYSYHVVYRPHQNKLIDTLTAKLRTRRYGKAIPKDNIRAMIRSLRQGNPLWYAPDQNYHGKNSIDAPFFGLPAATNPATSRLVEMTGATVLPFVTVRLPGEGYLLRFLPPFENFPTDDPEADTSRINAFIESQVREFPEQYLWTHKRFKVAGKDFYSDYLQQHPESSC